MEGCFVVDWMQTVDIGSSRSHCLFDIGKTDILDCAIASTVDNQAEIVTYTHEDMESFQDAEKCCNETEACVFRVMNKEASFVIGAVLLLLEADLDPTDKVRGSESCAHCHRTIVQC